MNTARSLYIVAKNTYGKRSMGDQLRHSQDGPRELEESDYRRKDLQPKVVANDPSAWVSVKTRNEPLVDPARIASLLEILDKRAGSQRGKPRSPDPANNPLGSRIYDVDCGWPMYREPIAVKGDRSFRYKCGAYTQSHGAFCNHNHINGPLATRFVVSAIRQRLANPRLRNRIDERLRTIAKAAQSIEESAAKLRCLQNELVEVEVKLKKSREDLAYAETPSDFKEVERRMNRHEQEVEQLSASIEAIKEARKHRHSAEPEIGAALELFDHLVERSNLGRFCGVPRSFQLG